MLEPLDLSGDRLPLVSVVCPTRMGIEHLESCIESILRQDYPNLELIVVDGGSDDGTIALLEGYGERLRYVSEPDSGQSEAINKGMAMAHGEILAWLNADDEYLPGAVRAAVDGLATTKAGLVYGDALALDGWGRRYGPRVNVAAGTSRRLIERGCFIVQPASFWRREVWEQVGPLREDLHYALDYELFMRMARRFDIAYWPQTFAIERLHAGAKTFNGHRRRIDEIRDSAVANGGDDLPTAFWPEGAAVYAVDGIRHATAGRSGEAREAWRQARKWATPVGRTVGFFLATVVAGGRSLPRARLLANLAISKKRHAEAPFHNSPDVPAYSLRAAGRGGRLRGVTAKLRQVIPNSAIAPRLGVLNQHPPKPLANTVPLVHHVPQTLPTMTIVTPSFNQAQFLGTTMDSVLSQGYPHLEYLVEDGGSTDHTVDVLAAQSHPDLSWVSHPDGGQAAAINAGHKKGTGEIMAWLNSDDILLPGTLKYVGSFFAENPDVDVVYSHRILIDEHGEEVGRWVLPPHDPRALTFADYVPQETMFWRRDIWNRVGGLDESFRFAMDWDLLLRFDDAGARTIRLPIFGGGFRVHSQQLTSAELDTLGAAEMKRLRRRCHGRDVTADEITRGLAPYFARHVALDRAWQAGLKEF